MVNKRDTVISILDQVLPEHIKLYSLEVRERPNHTLIDVILDSYQNQYGSVTLGECESASKGIKKYLEESSPNLDYTLKVSSAGADRELKLPEELVRFSGVPVRLYYMDPESGKQLDGVFRILETDDATALLEPWQKGRKSAKKKPPFRVDKKDILKGKLYVSL